MSDRLKGKVAIITGCNSGIGFATVKLFLQEGAKVVGTDIRVDNALKFAEEHPDVVTAFVKVTGDATAAYRANPESWNATSPEAEKIARLTGAKQDEVLALLKGYIFPTLEEQAGEALLGGGTVKAVADTSAFLLEQGKIPAALSDYAPYVSTRWVTDATKLAY